MSFLPKEPYRMPGYTGYVPDQIRHIEISKAQLSKTKHKHQDYQENLQDFANRTVKDVYEYKRLSKTTRGIPGWTGYIPTLPFEHGSDSFGTAQSKALKSFQSKTLKREQDLLRTKTDMKPIHKKPEIPRACTKTPEEFNREGLVQDAKFNWRKSGYTGFVPAKHGENIYGRNFQACNNQALKKFQLNHQHIHKLNDPTVRPSTMQYDRTLIYGNKGTSVLPHYTGHIPKDRYKFGSTKSHHASQANLPKNFIMEVI